jgi:molybdate transport system substrate-binding protein
MMSVAPGAACTSADAGSAARSGSTEGDGRLVVFAATSLRDAFTAFGADFERAHPDVDLVFHFAGTHELRMQLEHGASADVFASADPVHMEELARSGRVTDAVVFARNEPVIVVSRESALRIRSLADLPAATSIVLGTPEVPIGRYAAQLLDRASASPLGADFGARVEARVVSRELNVRQVLAKVSLGEAQAGIVYRTDAQAAGSLVSVVTIPSEINVSAAYPVARVTGATHPTTARAFVDLLLSDGGQRTLRAAGFLPPTGSPVAP